MEYCTGNQRKIDTNGIGIQDRKIYFLEKYRDLPERTFQSTLPTRNYKREGEFHKTIMEPTVTLLLAKLLG